VRIKLSFFLLILVFSGFNHWQPLSHKGNFKPANNRLSPELHVPASETTATPTMRPTATAQVNLPFVQQRAPTSTPTLSPFDAGYPAFIKTLSATPVEQSTPTPTPIPPQGESTNFPIVIGALVIISIVLLSWVVFGKK
jgi:hypothetical protein